MSAGQIPEKQMIPGAHIKEESGSTYKIRGGTFNHEETRFTVGGALHDSGDGDRMRIKTYTDTGKRSRDNDRSCRCGNESGGHDKTGSFQCGSEDGGRSGSVRDR